MTCSGFKLCSRPNARITLFHALVDCDENLMKIRNERHERTHLESGIDSKMTHDGDCVVISLVSKVGTTLRSVIVINCLLPLPDLFLTCSASESRKCVAEGLALPKLILARAMRGLCQFARG
jgi:hypothetical protein